MTEAHMSLVEFARKERLRDCPVCQLPADIRSQMQAATDKKIKRQVVLAWLMNVHGINLDAETLTTHYSGHHDA